MVEVAIRIARALFKEINENMALAERYWLNGDNRFLGHFQIARERLREFEKMFEE